MQKLPHFLYITTAFIFILVQDILGLPTPLLDSPMFSVSIISLWMVSSISCFCCALLLFSFSLCMSIFVFVLYNALSLIIICVILLIIFYLSVLLLLVKRKSTIFLHLYLIISLLFSYNDCYVLHDLWSTTFICLITLFFIHIFFKVSYRWTKQIIVDLSNVKRHSLRHTFLDLASIK